MKELKGITEKDIWEDYNEAFLSQTINVEMLYSLRPEQRDIFIS
jgi:hypothetical protein